MDVQLQKEAQRVASLHQCWDRSPRAQHFSRCDKPFAVWTQRDDLRSHARQFDLHAVGREPLVRRRVVAVGGNLADRFTRRGWNLRNGKDTKREAHEWLHRVMSVSDERLFARVSIATD